MLQDCIEVFKKLYKEKGSALIVDNHIPADGTYVLISFDKNEGEIIDSFRINYNKKTDEVEGRNNEYFSKICNFDYNSKLIDMNKPIDRKKIIHSNNYLSFFIKKENLSNGKLTEEIIDNYYNVLSNPYLKYSKSKAKEIYKSAENQLEEIDQELLEKMKNWIKENIFKLDELGVQISGKDYLKIFIYLPTEKYECEGKRYLIPNIYNSNDFNEKIDDNLYGLPNNNMNLNAKKPYLENKSRKTKVPYLVDKDEILIQKLFFDYLMNLATLGKVNLYIDEEIEAKKNGEVRKKDFQGMYMRIRKGKEVEILAYDEITAYKESLKNRIYFNDVLELKDELKVDVAYGTCVKREDLQKLIDEVLFSKYLKNNYFVDAKDVSIKDSVIKENVIIAREALFNWIFKGQEYGLYNILDKVSLALIKNSLSNGNGIKASHQFNLRCALEVYFNGGKNMGDIITDLKSNLKEKLGKEETDTFTSDEEYYFAVGQLASYLLSQSKSKNKPHSLVNPFINTKSNDVIKKRLKSIYLKYNYNIYGKKIKNIYAMIVSYLPSGKVNQDMILAGYLHNNLIYESNKEEKNNG